MPARPHVLTPAPPRLRTSARLFLVFSLALLAACSAKKPPAASERDPFINFAPFQTYAWLPPGHEPDANLFGTQAREAIDAQLRDRGYAQAYGVPPDLRVGTTVTVDEKFADSMSKFFKYQDAGGEKSFSEAYALGYEEATLHVEVFDSRTQQRVWHGSTWVVLTAKQRADRAAAGVAEMFKTFPSLGGVMPPKE
ncbi:MAG: DUF4136 domain-containing protein [bacterium]